MKKPNTFRSLLLSLFGLILVTLIPAQTAQADIFNDIATVLDKLDEVGANPYASQGLTGPVVLASRGLVVCLADGTNVIECIDTHVQGSPLQDELEDDIPGWFWDFIDVYIAWDSGNYAEVIQHLGPAAGCFVMQFFSGVDICGMITEIIELAKEVLETFSAFFQGIAQAFKDLVCAVPGACNEPEDPPEKKAWDVFFFPELQNKNGMKKRHTGTAHWNNYLSGLKQKAESKYGTSAALFARNEFVKAVDIQWNEWVTHDLYPDLLSARASYKTPANQEKLISKVVPPVHCIIYHSAAETTCSLDLSASGRVQTWIDDDKVRAASLGVISNDDWCRDYITGFKDEIDRRSADFVKNELNCYMLTNDGTTSISDAMWICPDREANQCCNEALIEYQGMKNVCTIHRGNEGKRLAEKIVADFKAQHSVTTYKIIEPTSAVTAAVTPCKLICERQPQQHLCHSYNTAGESVYVDCVLEEDPAYGALKVAVQGAITTLNSGGQQHVMAGNFHADFRDPLLVYAPTIDQYNMTKEENQNFQGIGHFIYTLSPEQYQHPVDGLSTPVMTYKSGEGGGDGRIINVHKPVQKELVFESPVDPIAQKFTVADEISNQDVLKEKSLLKAKDARSLTKQEPSITGNKMAIRASGISNHANAGSNAAPAQVMSHQTNGEVKRPKTTPPLSILDNKKSLSQTHPTVQPRTLLLADLQLEDTVRVANRNGRWGSTINITDNKGECDATLKYSLLNAGDAATGSFKTRWIAPPGIRPAPKAPLQAGATRIETETHKLVPGINRFTLILDSANQIQEQEETNNRYTLTIRVSGTCGKKKRPTKSTLSPPKAHTPQRVLPKKKEPVTPSTPARKLKQIQPVPSPPTEDASPFARPFQKIN